jgi:hypothetical protein
MSQNIASFFSREEIDQNKNTHFSSSFELHVNITRMVLAILVPILQRTKVVMLAKANYFIGFINF